MNSDMNVDEIYQQFYSKIKNSITFSKYCKMVFGIDLSQDGFSDKTQLDFMIKILAIKRTDTCLDIGCGNGKIAQYINENTSASIKGIDYSDNAIGQAKVLESDFNRLHFHTENINNLKLEKDKYSVIYLIDSIYFSNNYEKTLNSLYNSLIPGGRIAIYYSDFIFNKEEQAEKIEKNKTKIAVILNNNNWCYEAYDFTKDHYEHMIKKYLVSNELKNEFIAENNFWLYQKINRESVKQDMQYEEFVKFTNRYLYYIKK